MIHRQSFREGLQAMMEQSKTEADNHEHLTPQERAFLEGMAERKHKMEALVRETMTRHAAPTYRTAGRRASDFQPAYDFLHELESYLQSHNCMGDPDACWVKKLSKIYERYVIFLKVYSLLIVVRRSLENSHLLFFEPAENDE